ncbi:M99 family carboxypeptidase catalytic domain-containing protein [Campylobacter sp. MOP7]|uniref:M99 family carboxypeptidase catalytic domain-containing protein n=1 Tax=Campylobacter canis TaxID=3378588 RepID=UPI00387E4692
MILRYIFVFFAFFIGLYAQDFKHTLIKKGTDDNNTLLLIGGIQGDEPGGFLAASLVATDYNITSGSVWVVPNLNFISILKRSRGTKGDMNRKFQYIDKNDPDYEAVTDIKKLIRDKNVSLILNLHDGSGFYRDEFIDKDRNPNKWGNTVIIDQAFLENGVYKNLQGIAESVIKSINLKLLNKEHRYHVKNTKTKEGDMEMLRSLTYYAITQGKSAFANEASKNLNAEQRTYYHLLAIEEYMNMMGIKFTRPFDISVKSVKNAIEKTIDVSLFNDKFILSLKNPRSSIKFIPLPKNEKLELNASNPITAAIEYKNGYQIRYGNRLLTSITPEFFEYSNSFDEILVDVDGKRRIVKLGSKILVKDFFEIDQKEGARVNIIGYTSKNTDEAGHKVSKNNMMTSFSLDKSGKIYRVEIYELGKKDKFVGMILVEFVK